MSEAAEPTVDANNTDADLRAADGRLPGRRGRATRQRLLERTAELLAATSYRELKVVDIAREAGTSPATFYQYFTDVEHAILVLGESIMADAERLAELVRGEWGDAGSADDGYATAQRIVHGFMEFWESHRSILRVIDLATEEGDFRFQSLRTRALNAITEALADDIRAAKRAGKLPAVVDPMASAGVLVAMLAHVSSHRWGFENWGIRTKDLETNLSRILYWSVTGSPPEG